MGTLNSSELDECLHGRPVSVAGAHVTGAIEGHLDNPSDGSILMEARWADAPTALAALDEAKQAGAGWSRTGAETRVELLSRLADALASKAGTVALAEALDTGKPLPAAHRAVETAIEGLRAYTAADLYGSDDLIQWEAIGTVCAILPSNAALFTAGIRAGTALTSGCALVLKPPPEAALTVTMLVDLALEVGFPPGVLISVPGGAEVGSALVEGRPDMVLFTGGRATGLRVASMAGAGGVPVHLELGGGAMVIVAPDADVDLAAEALVAGSFSNQGQVCVSSRIIRVHAACFDRFSERFVAGAKSLHIGPATDPTTQFGPLQTTERLAQMETLTRDLPGIVTGGQRPSDPSLPLGGYYFSPTVVAGMPADPLSEVFGPIAFLAPYEDADEVVDEVNATTSGLAAGVWGAPETAVALASRLETGQVYVNRHFNPTAGSVPGEPWGRSGIGRSGLPEHLRVRRLFLP